MVNGKTDARLKTKNKMCFTFLIFVDFYKVHRLSKHTVTTCTFFLRD